MKMFAILLLPVALLLQHDGCDVSGGPDSVRSKFQAQLTPYFRNAKVEVNGKDEAILGLTCNTDAGPKLIAQAQDMLAHSEGIGKLRSLQKWGPALGSHVYRTVAIGFADTVVTMDVASNKITQAPASDDYRRHYEAACRPAAATASSVAASIPDVSIYVAYYRITPQKPVDANSPAPAASGTPVSNANSPTSGAPGTPANGRASFVVFDTVGLWSDADWPEHRDAEIAARRDMILKDYGARFPGATVDFIASEKVPVPQSLVRRAEQEERASAAVVSQR